MITAKLSAWADRFVSRSRSHLAAWKQTAARRSMRISAAFKPSGYGLSQLAELCIAQGDMLGARKSIQASMVAYKGTHPIEVTFYAGVIESNLGDFDAAEKWLRQSLQIDATYAFAIYALGSLLCVRGKLQEAEALFALDVPVLTGTGRHTHTRVLCSPASKERAPERTVAMGTQDRKASAAVFFAAADSTYFCRYARQVANSIKRFGAVGTVLHLHVINPNDDATALAAELAGVTVTTEQVDLHDWDDEQRKTYYACARYRLLPELMDFYQAPLVVVDIDQVVMSDPTPLLVFAKAHDASILSFGGAMHNILSLFSATLLVVNPTAGGKRFAQQLHDHIEASLQAPSHVLWHLDQAALARTRFGLSGVDIGMIPAAMVHLGVQEPAPRRAPTVGIFWSITNSIPTNLEKLKSSGFQQFS